MRTHTPPPNRRSVRPQLKNLSRRDYLGLVVESARQSLVNPVRNTKWSPKNGLVGKAFRDGVNYDDRLMYHVPMQYRESLSKKFAVDFNNCVYDTIQEYCHTVKRRLSESVHIAALSTDKLRDVVSPVLVNDNDSGISRDHVLRIVLIPETFDLSDAYRPGMNIETDCEDIDQYKLSDIIDSLQNTSIEGLFDANLGSTATFWDICFFKPDLPHALQPDLHLGLFRPNEVLVWFGFDSDGNLLEGDFNMSDVEFRLYVCSDGDRPFAYRIPEEIPVSNEPVD